MKLFSTLFAITAATPALLAQDDPGVTYGVVVHGTACKQSLLSSSQVDCEYKVGRDLTFVIAGVGQDDAAITVLRTGGYEGDYYATFGVSHGCVIVKPGTRSKRDGVVDMAFVSPATGKVYATWQECGRATRRVPHN